MSASDIQDEKPPSTRSANDECNNTASPPDTALRLGDMERGTGAPQNVSNIVDWDGPDDPEKPPNFSRPRKWLVTVMMGTLTLTVAFSSAVFTQATEITAREFHVSSELMILATTFFILGLGLGPMVWG